MELDWTAESVGGVTLVSFRLENERTVDRRVRLRNRLDGPVLPPRRQREPEAGWDSEGLTAVVPAGSTGAYGYACPAPQDEPPVAIAQIGPPDDPVAGGERTDNGDRVADVIRRLGDARPPRAAVGARTTSDGEKAETTTGEDEHEGGNETVALEIAAPDEAPPEDGECGVEQRPWKNDLGRTDPAARPQLPSNLVTTLAPYRRRVETVEALGLASVTEATALLEANGGLDGIEGVGNRLDADAAALRALAVEATALAARAEAATAPVGALRRLS
jgi:hypothetical protein